MPTFSQRLAARVAAVLLATAAALLGLLAGPVHAQGDDGQEPERGLGVRLLDLPANNADDPRANIYVVDEVDPGTTFTRRMEVVNDTDAPVTVEVHPVASDITDDRGWQVADGRTGNELTSWIRVDPATVEVPARGEAPVEVTFAVPEDAVGGERYATLVAQPVADPDAEGIVQVSRVGIRTYLFVTGDTRPRFGLEVVDIRASVDEAGQWRVEADVTSTGTRAVDATGTLRLTAPDAPLTAGPYASAPPGATMAPGQTGTLVFPVGEPLGQTVWDAEVTAVSGDDVEAVGRARIDFTGADGPLQRDCGLWCPVAIASVATTAGAHVRRWWVARRG